MEERSDELQRLSRKMNGDIVILTHMKMKLEALKSQTSDMKLEKGLTAEQVLEVGEQSKEVSNVEMSVGGNGIRSTRKISNSEGFGSTISIEFQWF